MKKIESFKADHRTITPGMYISRTDGDITTYDIRFVKPNGGEYLSNASMHTTEHLFATYVRNSPHADSIVYVGPMGCRTGFYLLARGLTHSEAIELVRESFEYIADFEGEIPGATEEECGNYLEHDLAGAKEDITKVLKTLTGYDEKRLDYLYNMHK
jgi:S-ribosylhomocysteine lyase